VLFSAIRHREVPELTSWLKPWPASAYDRSRYAESIFRRVAPRYDTLTRLLSFGGDGRWKEEVASAACASGRTARILDLATGTAAFPLLLSRRGHEGPIVALDRSGEMLAIGRRKCAGLPRVRFVRGDLNALPMGECAFDAVTIGYGLRYPADLHLFARDVFRLLKPGGVFLSLDFGLPRHRAFRSLAMGYLLVFGAVWGLLLHGRPATYAHIVESLRAYPGQEALARILEESGFREALVSDHWGGITVTVRAVRPLET